MVELILFILFISIIGLIIILITNKRQEITIDFSKNSYNLIKCQIKSKETIKNLVKCLSFALILKCIILYDFYSLFAGLILLIYEIFDNKLLMVDGSVLLSNVEPKGKGKAIGSPILTPQDESVREPNRTLDKAKESKSDTKDIGIPAEYKDHVEHSLKRKAELNKKANDTFEFFVEKYMGFCSSHTKQQLMDLVEAEQKKLEATSEKDIPGDIKKQYLAKSKFEFARNIECKKSYLKKMDLIYNDSKSELSGIYLKALERSYQLRTDEIKQAIVEEKSLYANDLKFFLQGVKEMGGQHKGKGK